MLDAQGNPVGQPQPLIRFRAYQETAFWRLDDVRRILLLWRRQAGKTYTLAAYCLKLMMEAAWRLVTFVSASLMVGKEMIEKEAQIWRGALDVWRKQAKAGGTLLETNADDDSGRLLDYDAFLDIFSKSRLEAKLYHSKTSYSRTQIIAPNPDTARGYTGTVVLDEIGFIKGFADMMDAMSPISSSDPSFRCLMATTPPRDDAHESWNLAAPAGELHFEPNAKGHFYRSEAGILVHRCDVHDAQLAGVHLYDEDNLTEDGEGIFLTPQEHRARAVDRDSWDRNYGLVFIRGGTSAVQMADLHRAMELGRGQCLFAQDNLPQASDIVGLLGRGPVSLGYDIATTEGKTSNPSSITLAQREGPLFLARLILVWKAADPEVPKALLRELIGLLLSAGHRPQGLDIDATSERYFAAQVRVEFAPLLPVGLVVAGEKTQFRGEDLNWKNYLGNGLLNLLQDGRMALPESRYVRDDFRLVKRTPTGLNAEVASDGKHADTFDSTKLAIHRLFNPHGPAFAEAVELGDFRRSGVDQGWKNPYAAAFDGGDGGLAY
jgi:hypothetical protein